MVFDAVNEDTWEKPEPCNSTEYNWDVDFNLMNTRTEVGGQVSMPTLCISSAGNISFANAVTECP